MKKGGRKEKKRKEEINRNRKKYDKKEDVTEVNNMRIEIIIILILMNI